jgi:hypothetical protein
MTRLAARCRSLRRGRTLVMIAVVAPSTSRGAAGLFLWDEHPTRAALRGGFLIDP